MFGEDPSSPPVPVRGPGGSGLFDSEILISGRMALVAVESKITEITALIYGASSSRQKGLA